MWQERWAQPININTSLPLKARNGMDWWTFGRADALLPPPGLACVMQDLKLLSFNVQWFGCFVFESWVLRFRDLGASCFGLRFRVLRFQNYHASNALSSFMVIF